MSHLPFVFFGIIQLLQVDHCSVFGTSRIQLVMFADSDYLPVIDEHDLVHTLHRCYTVSDQDGRFALTRRAEVFKYDLFGLYVNCRDRVVKDEYCRILHERACNGDTLLLSAGNGHAAFAEHCIITFGKFHYVIVNIRQLCGGFNIVMISAVGGKGDVAFNCFTEQEIILRDICGVFSDGAYRDCVDIVTVDEKGAVGDVISAEYQVDKRCFSGAGFADDADVFARLYFESER